MTTLRRDRLFCCTLDCHFCRDRFWHKPVFEALDVLRDLCEKHNTTLVSASLRWLKHHSALSGTCRNYGRKQTRNRTAWYTFCRFFRLFSLSEDWRPSLLFKFTGNQETPLTILVPYDVTASVRRSYYDFPTDFYRLQEAGGIA